MKVVNQIGEVAFASPEAKIVETVSKDALWSCTNCRTCQEICPASIEHVNKIVDMRRNLVLMEGEFPGEGVMAAAENIEVNNNPFGLGYATRGEWSEALGVKPLAEDPAVDILCFVGCYASFDKRNIKIATSFIKLCKAAGIKVGILGKEEKCCGDPVRKLGNEYLYQSQAAENIEVIKGYNVKKVVTTCPHCFNTLAKDYRDLGFELEVEHYTVFLENLVTRGSLKLRAAGGKVAEIKKSESDSFCCGAGGGRILAEENLGERIANKRVGMAAETGANMLVSNCPFCLTMFEDGIKGLEKEESMAVKDIAEILVERLV